MKGRLVPTIFLAVVLLANGAGADWTSFQGDERNTGAGPAEYRPYEAVWWNVAANVSLIEGSPIVAEGLVIIAGTSGQVRALSLASGEEAWNVSMPAKVVATPAVERGRVYVVDVEGNLRSLEVRTGEQRASFKVGATLGTITVREDNLYIGNEAGVMYRLLADSLTEIWRFDTASLHLSQTTNNQTGAVTCTQKVVKGAIRGAPAVYKGKVIFGSFNNYVYAVQEEGTGTLAWAFRTGDIVLASPSIDTARDRAIIGSFDKKVYALPVAGSSAMACSSPTGGYYAPMLSAAWTFTVPDKVGNSNVRATAAIGNDKVFVGALNGVVYALEATNGQALWAHDVGGAVAASPVTANGTVVAINEQGRIRWIAADTGFAQKDHVASSTIKSGPALVGDRTVVASFDGRIILLGGPLPQRPDLVVQDLSVEGMELALTVRNGGDGGSEATHARVSVDGSFLAEGPVPALAAGDTTRLTWTLPRAGDVFVEIQLDPADLVVESDEGNNIQNATLRATAPVTTTDPVTPGPTTPSTVAPPTPTGPREGIPAAPLLLVATGVLALAMLRRP